jgi:hypothetical protein
VGWGRGEFGRLFQQTLFFVISSASLQISWFFPSCVLFSPRASLAPIARRGDPVRYARTAASEGGEAPLRRSYAPSPLHPLMSSVARRKRDKTPTTTEGDQTGKGKGLNVGGDAIV